MTHAKRALATVVIAAWVVIAPLIVVLLGMSFQQMVTDGRTHQATGLAAVIGGVDGRPVAVEGLLIMACWFVVPKAIWRKITGSRDAAAEATPGTTEVPPPLPTEDLRNGSGS